MLRRVVGVACALVTAVVMVGLTVLTVARFVATDDRRAILLASFSSYALLGFLVVLAACLVALRFARHRRWVGAAAGLAAVGVLVQAWSVVPLFVGGSDNKADLTVMTSNLRFGRGDIATVLRTLDSDGVDVLVLEEVTPPALSALLAAGVTNRLPHQLGTPSGAADGTMVFSRYPLRSPQAFELGNRGLQVVVQAPEPFTLLAVHTAQPLDYTPAWVVDMQRVRARAEATADRPTLMVGDFNATLDHAQFRDVLATGLTDAAEQAGSGWQPTWPTRVREEWLRPLVAIDHVLVSEEYDALRTRSVEVDGTDHFTVVADLRRRNSD